MYNAAKELLQDGQDRQDKKVPYVTPVLPVLSVLSVLPVLSVLLVLCPFPSSKNFLTLLSYGQKKEGLIMYKILLACLFSLFLTSCNGPHHVDYFPYHDDGTMKPRIALIPVQDLSNSDVPWCLAQELNQGVRYHAMDSGELYLLSRSEMGEGLDKCRNYALFGPDLSYAKNFSDADYVVALELIEHEEQEFDKRVHNCGINLSGRVLVMKMRLRIIDVRCKEPRILLQEIVKYDCSIPRCKRGTNLNLIPYGAEAYPQSPYGTAHKSFTEIIVSRIEKTTWGAK